MRGHDPTSNFPSHCPEFQYPIAREPRISRSLDQGCSTVNLGCSSTSKGMRREGEAIFTALIAITPAQSRSY
jgi:hypothetical protein